MTLLNRVRGFADLTSRGEIVVKSCGIIQVEHALAAARYGSNMVGLVFARSKRSVSSEKACAIRLALDEVDRRPLLVGVFVNEMPSIIFEIAERVGLDVIQLSGDEGPVEVAECAQRYPVLKALRFPQGITVEAALEEIARYREAVLPDKLRFVVDTYHDGEYGGTGRIGDWGIASMLAEHEKIMLAGGLTPQNVGWAVKEVAPWGVDVSSGIERDNVKDTHLIEAFNTNARSVSVT